MLEDMAESVQVPEYLGWCAGSKVCRVRPAGIIHAHASGSFHFTRLPKLNLDFRLRLPIWTFDLTFQLLSSPFLLDSVLCRHFVLPH